MKKTFFCISKSPLMTVVFVGFMAIVTTATAQNDTVNPLVSTTGPNVLGAGRIQWNNSIEYLHDGSNLGVYRYNSHSFGLATGFRFGIGSRAELTLDLEGRYNTFDNANHRFHNTTGITPSIGAKLLLNEGKGWLPQTSFYTYVSNSFDQHPFDEEWSSLVQPQIGFQFRNRLGQSWLLDYSLGYSWNRYSTDDYINFVGQIDYSIHLWDIISEGKMVGFGISNRNSAHVFSGYTEVRRQLNDNLQLYFQVGIQAGFGKEVGILDRLHGLVGLSWMLK